MNERNNEAVEWWLRLAETTLDPAEELEFDTWLSDAENLQAFRRTVALWQSIDQVAEQLFARPFAFAHRRRHVGFVELSELRGGILNRVL